MRLIKESSCHVSLTAVSEASMESAIGASCCGCASMVASASACLVALKACNMSSIQERRVRCFDRCALPENVATSGRIS